MGVKIKKMKNTIKFSDASKLSAVLGKCVIKELGNGLFIPVIKAKSNLSAIVENYSKLELSVFKELGFNDGVVPNGTPIEAFQSLSKAQKELGDQLTEVDDLLLFSAENLQKLSDENPKLTTSELEVVYELMVKK